MQCEQSILEQTLFPQTRNELHWYAVHTRANHEKRVAEQLNLRKIEQFLPLYESIRQWKDRRVRLSMPLFAGYIFVRIGVQERLSVLKIPGVAGLVGFGGQPAPLPSEEMEALQLGLADGTSVEPHPYLAVGDRVRIRKGPFQGLQGILLKQDRNTRVVISIELIMRSVAVNIDRQDIESMSHLQ